MPRFWRPWSAQYSMRGAPSSRAAKRAGTARRRASLLAGQRYVSSCERARRPVVPGVSLGHQQRSHPGALRHRAGGSVTNAMFQPTQIDVADDEGAGLATFNGRFTNPPFLFGVGGVELLGLEMTADLQVLKQSAMDNPGPRRAARRRACSSGRSRDTRRRFDWSDVEGVDEDLVVRPFGRKGEFPTVRAFDVAPCGSTSGCKRSNWLAWTSTRMAMVSLMRS